jgi:L-ascorbate metabolism protein UlaG (beta-lactamase superfamily)
MLFLLIILLLIAAVALFMRQPKFGKAAGGERLQKMKSSPNYSNGQFQNEHHTPSLKEGVSVLKVMRQFFFNKSKRSKPAAVLPSRKTDLHALSANKNVLVWFGHSSYFMQVDGKKILVDPVLGGSASPLAFTTRSFAGSDVYTTHDIPAIDYLFITHDHWDHMDYATIMLLKPKVSTIITGLGTAAHLERWGFDAGRIIERDWNEEAVLSDGFKVNTTPARHFSGRGFKRNGSLWMSFVLTTPTTKIFIGGDSGYDSHFAAIGNKFGPFDIAILECGQYNDYWHYIHMMPEEVVKAAQELRAKKLLPVHWSKFSLSLHAWDEPIIKVVEESNKMNMPVIHPMIGEEVNLQQDQVYTQWWKNV